MAINWNKVKESIIDTLRKTQDKQCPTNKEKCICAVCNERFTCFTRSRDLTFEECAEEIIGMCHEAISQRNTHVLHLEEKIRDLQYEISKKEEMLEDSQERLRKRRRNPFVLPHRK